MAITATRTEVILDVEVADDYEIELTLLGWTVKVNTDDAATYADQIYEAIQRSHDMLLKDRRTIDPTISPLVVVTEDAETPHMVTSTCTRCGNAISTTQTPHGLHPIWSHVVEPIIHHLPVPAGITPEGSAS